MSLLVERSLGRGSSAHGKVPVSIVRRRLAVNRLLEALPQRQSERMLGDAPADPLSPGGNLDP